MKRKTRKPQITVHKKLAKRLLQRGIKLKAKQEHHALQQRLRKYKDDVREVQNEE